MTRKVLIEYNEKTHIYYMTNKKEVFNTHKLKLFEKVVLNNIRSLNKEVNELPKIHDEES